MIHSPNQALAHTQTATNVIWHLPLTQSAGTPVNPWQADILDAVEQFSGYLLKHPDARQYPEIIALGFWFRGTHVKQLAAAKSHKMPAGKAKTVFHIAPANVDTVFMYSVLLSVLCGNQNIVRVSERSGDVTWLLIKLLKAFIASPQGKTMAPLIGVVQYPASDQDVTAALSQWSDLRVIWGGDKAVAAISAIAPQTPQICFPDRYSVAVLKLDARSDIPAMAKALLADVLPFGQQACSSPKALYWLDTVSVLQVQFWQAVQQEMRSVTHHLELSDKVEQHILLQTLAAGFALQLIAEDCGSKFASVLSMGALARAKVKTLTAAMLQAHRGHGLLLEQDIGCMDEIACSAKLQTVSYAGIPQTELLPAQGQCKRLVPLGKALEFNEKWDGVDLISVFSGEQTR